MIRQAYLIEVDERELREFLQERHSDLRGLDFAVERVEERSYGGLRIWVTEAAAEPADDPFRVEVPSVH